MFTAGLWGTLAGSSLLLGAIIGIYTKIPSKLISFIMAFGAGVLLSSVAFELMEESYKSGGFDACIIGMTIGTLAFFIGDYFISKKGGKGRKSSQGTEDTGSANAILLGALMDGIPESLAIGISIIHGGKVSFAMMIAVFISNIPEALSSATGMLKSGHSKKYIVGLWTAVVIVSGISSMIGYKFLFESSGNITGGIQSFAAGAILTMVSSTMLPEAFEETGNVVGLLTSLGFLLSFILSHLS